MKSKHIYYIFAYISLAFFGFQGLILTELARVIQIGLLLIVSVLTMVYQKQNNDFQYTLLYAWIFYVLVNVIYFSVIMIVVIT